jgi:molecular chaperone HscB
MNYFELFEIPVSLNPDKQLLNKKYIELQKRFHPDFFTQADEAEQAEVLEKSSLINKGIKVLQNKQAILQYVLQIKGCLPEAEKYALPPDFLMEMMELNELEPEAATLVIADIETQLAAEIDPIIVTYNDETISKESLEKLKAFYYKKKYLQRILDKNMD